MTRVLNAKGQDLRTVSRELKRLIEEESVVTIKNASHLHGLCAGLKKGQITIEGDGGDYLGVLNDGATIRVRGNAGKYIADNMTRGMVLVEGDADYGAAQYCYGGTVFIRGNAGDFAATMNKGATIIIGQDIGDEVGTYMLAGDLIIIGNAGLNLGNYLIRGNIYIGGQLVSLGHNCRQEGLDPEDLTKLEGYFAPYDIAVKPKRFKKIIPQSAKPFYK